MVSYTYFIQERDTFHQRVSRIRGKYHHYYSIFCMLTSIFRNMILHTHFLLHLYLISFFLDYLSLINTKSRFERDKVRKIEKEDGRGDCLAKVEEES